MIINEQFKQNKMNAKEQKAMNDIIFINAIKDMYELLTTGL